MAQKHKSLSRTLHLHRSLFIVGFAIFILAIAKAPSIRSSTNKLISVKKQSMYVAKIKNEYKTFANIDDSELEAARTTKSNLQLDNLNMSFSQSVPVLLYHSISDTKGQYTVSPAEFKEQMFTLKKLGYNTLTIEQYIGFINGSYKPPVKSVLITFDDGTNTGYDEADPIFEALNFHATNFIITKNSIEKNGSHYYLSKDKIKTMVRSGRWDIEVHTNAGHIPYKIDQKGSVGNFYSNKIWNSKENRIETEQEFAIRVEKDIDSAIDEIKPITGKTPTAMAFPFGDHGQNTVNYPGAQDALLRIVQSKFKVAMVQYYAGRGYSHEYFGDNSLLARRIEVQPAWSGSDLEALIEAGASKQAQFDDNFAQNKGWRQQSGDVDISQYNLKLNTSTSRKTSTASVSLDGSFYWSNYSFSADMGLTSGTSMVLMARKLNSSNYVGCTFSPGEISVIQVSDSKRTVLNSGKYLLNPAHKDVYGITVENNMIGCTINGTLMAIGESSTVPRNGGVGISIWDPVIGTAQAVVSRVSVKPTEKTVDPTLLNTDLEVYANWHNLSSQPEMNSNECSLGQRRDIVSVDYFKCNYWSRSDAQYATVNTGIIVESRTIDSRLQTHSGVLMNYAGINASSELSNYLISGGTNSE